jgi:serine/threonine-protein kinase
MMGETSTLSRDLLGTVLLGRYRIVRELAKGGMGVVYLARAEGAVGFVKPVVVKLVLPEHASDQRFVSMFAREAQILANLRHASIVDVVEFGEQDGAYVMVLEYVRGYHVGQWARYLRLKGRAVPAIIALQVIIDVLDALDHAHSMVHPDGTSMHIVHRDISPSNILLDEDGRARLLDFGVARMRGGEYEYQTQVKGFVGKLMYSAPEIFADGDATPISDLYSCAVVLHETLLGRNTFRADNQAKTLHRVLNHAPEPLEPAPGIPHGLDAVLNKALAKSPDDRFGSARELAAALRALQPQPENDVRASLAALLKNDFGREIAELLGIESLSDRDDAWRRQRPTSSAPPPALDPLDATYRHDVSVSSFSDITTGGGNTTQGPTAVEGRRSMTSLRPVSELPSLRPGPLPSVRPLPAPTAATATAPGMNTGPQPKPARSTSPLAWAMAVLGAGLLIFVASQNARPNPPPKIRVVSEVTPPKPEIRPEPTIASLTKPAQTPVTERTSAPSSSAPLKPAETKPAAHSEIPRARGDSELGSSEERRLTRALRKQQDQFTACFAQHAKTLKSLPPIKLEFELLPDGKLSALRVIPAVVAGSELGRCLHSAASGTHFPALGKPVSFAVPLSASVGH